MREAGSTADRKGGGEDDSSRAGGRRSRTRRAAGTGDGAGGIEKQSTLHDRAWSPCGYVEFPCSTTKSCLYGNQADVLHDVCDGSMSAMDTLAVTCDQEPAARMQRLLSTKTGELRQLAQA